MPTLSLPRLQNRIPPQPRQNRMPALGSSSAKNPAVQPTVASHLNQRRNGQGLGENRSRSPSRQSTTTRRVICGSAASSARTERRARAKKIEDLGLPVTVVPRQGATGAVLCGRHRTLRPRARRKRDGLFENARLLRCPSDKKPSGHSAESNQLRIRRIHLDMTTEMKFGARSDTGCVRENNEDSFGAAPEMNLFVLSDGMGGLEAGEVASRMAVDAVLEHCRQAEANPDLPLSRRAHRERFGNFQPPGQRDSRGQRIGLPHRAAGHRTSRHGRDDRRGEVHGPSHERRARGRQPHLSSPRRQASSSSPTIIRSSPNRCAAER